MIGHLPLELLNEIISHLDVPDRLSLRAACKTTNCAVANSDIYLPTISVTRSIEKRRKEGSKLSREVFTVDFGEHLSFHGRKWILPRILRIRKLLFKRAFATNGTLDLIVDDDKSDAVLFRILEGIKCESQWYKERISDKVRSFLEVQTNLELSIYNSIVDHSFLLSFTRPVNFGNGENCKWKLDDSLLVELVRRGNGLWNVPVRATQPDSIVSVIRIIASTAQHHYCKIVISRSAFHRFLKFLGIIRTDHGYFAEKEIEGVCVISDIFSNPAMIPYAVDSECMLEYNGTVVTVFNMEHGISLYVNNAIA